MDNLDYLINEIFDEIKNYEKSSNEIPIAYQGVLLYHYTSINGLMGILEEKSFRISQANFLNDSLEIKYIKECVRNTIEGMNIKNSELFDELCDYIGMAEHEFNWDPSFWANNAYILSLSENPDSLMLWSYYSKFDGYNLGIDFYKLLHSCDRDRIINLHGKVIYDEYEQSRRVRDKINGILDIYNKYAACLPDGDLRTIRKHLIERFILKMGIYSLFFKHPSFKHEEEYRLVSNIYLDLNPKFRNSNGVIIPYIQLPIEKGNFLPVKTITIGPKNNIDIAEKGVKNFIQSIGYNSSDIKVNKSKVPLRY
ncbi:DUF2971 domain-containing protein [Clostridium swellfunianum]|uniref:DUF2971 domain-containing protein n=1 Tax=Clostridium swellfunianum TaxID=1367462 RepID=UPI00202DC6BC|nr:DUF2971 domain-containing protein [Clostridium swellfunianum]MCM0648650.1 DUF2971 domain-containing protein [Clostridium swellfunianum]